MGCRQTQRGYGDGCFANAITKNWFSSRTKSFGHAWGVLGWSKSKIGMGCVTEEDKRETPCTSTRATTRCVWWKNRTMAVDSSIAHHRKHPGLGWAPIEQSFQRFFIGGRERIWNLTEYLEFTCTLNIPKLLLILKFGQDLPKSSLTLRIKSTVLLGVGIAMHCSIKTIAGRRKRTLLLNVKPATQCLREAPSLSLREGFWTFWKNHAI